MKILTINTRYIGGGGAAYIANMLHHQLNKMDEYESTFLYGRGVDGDENSKRIMFNKMDYISALSYRLCGREINFNKNFEEDIKDCDIVHLHNVHGYYINYEILFKLLKKYNKKIIWTLHDMWPITGRCAYSFGCKKWMSGCGNCPNKNSYPKSFIDRSNKELENKNSIIGSIDKENMVIVTPSKWLANMCKKSYLNKFKIIDIPNGIDNFEIKELKDVIRSKYNVAIDKKTVLFVAADTSDERKGIKFILDIIPKCKNYNFISIGKEISEIELENFVQLGYIKDRKKLNEVYLMADIFVIPSLDDNFPTTVIEALSNGTPVIGFNQGGIPEQIDHNKTGRVVNQISSEALQKEIIYVLEDENKLKELSIAAKEKFLKEYKFETFMERYLKEYKSLEE